MTADGDPSGDFEVVIAGGGVAALEAMLALRTLGGSRVAIKLLAPDTEYRYRPLAVREPFSSAHTTEYPLSDLAACADAELVADSFKWLDPDGRTVHTRHGRRLQYDAVLLALGARQHPRFRDALTLDDGRLGEQLASFVARIDEGSIGSVAFVVPSLPIWSLPAYELALMTANRAHTGGHRITVMLITPEDAPLAALGVNASAEVGRLLAQANVTTVTSANCQIREPGKIEIYPLRRSFEVDEIIALPELYAPAVPGVPTSAERGFITIDQYGAVRGLRRVYAAGDITDTPVKHGGLSAEQADVAAQAIAALAGAPVEPRPTRPALHVMLLGAARPLFIRSQMLGDHGVDLEISESPLWDPVGKLHAEYLGPCLDGLDAQRSPAG
jgi:sulfide:quinone oxidoreductase